MTSLPSRKELRARALVPFRPGRNWTKADIFLWEDTAPPLAIKDYAARPLLVRATLGRCLVSRECAAYRQLQGVPGIPSLAGRIDPFAFAVTFVKGADLSRLRRGDLPAAFFTRLLHLLESMHRAGVAQGDLHHRDVIQGSSGEPFLVDFSTAVFRGISPGPLRRRLFEAACASDRRAVLKLKRRHVPEDLTEEERGILAHPPAWYRLGKSLRRLLPSRKSGRRPPGER